MLIQNAREPAAIRQKQMHLKNDEDNKIFRKSEFCLNNLNNFITMIRKEVTFLGRVVGIVRL